MAESNLLPSGTNLDARWKQLYAAAVWNSTISNCPIAEARAAMLDRAEYSLANSSGEERRTLNDALRILRILEEITFHRNPAA